MKELSRTSPARLARQLNIPKSRGLEAVLKAQLIAAIVAEVGRRKFTHADVAARSGLPRSAVTGILSGSRRLALVRWYAPVPGKSCSSVARQTRMHSVERA
jgi:hypothetical protein